MAATSNPVPLRQAFLSQRSRARARGIEWHFSFEEWLQVWAESGHLAERGMGKGRYVMARRGDAGPYAAWNVRIQLCEKNASDARTNHPESNGRGALLRTGGGRGWTLKKGRYQVYVSKCYVGTFESQVEAEAAYRTAAVKHLEAVGVL